MTALLLAVLGAAADPAAAWPALPPCAACIRWDLSAEQAERLVAEGVELRGVSVLLPAGAATTAPALARAGASVAIRAGVDAGAQAPDGFDAVVLTLPAGAETAEGAYLLKTAATALRARHPALRVGVEGALGVLAALHEAGAGAYLDFVVGPAAAGTLERWRRSAADSAAAALAATREAEGTVLTPWPGAGAAADAPLAVARLAGLLTPSLAPLVEADAACEPVVAGCEAAVYLHESGDAVVMVRPGDEVVEGVSLALRGASNAAEAPQSARLHDLASAQPARPLAVSSRDGLTRVAFPATGAPFVLQLEGWGGAHARFGAGVDVVARRDLAVEEIVARHQAWAARQRAAVPRSIAEGSLAIAFQAPGLTAPVSVTADVTLYFGPHGTEIEQRALRLNGLALGGGDVPRLPLIEPERVAAPPLAITLGAAYRYRLEGRGPHDGRDCYRVAFAPAAASGPSFRGRAWIDSASFALVRLEATQTGLRGPIVSSHQTDEFAPVAHGGGTVWLLARTSVHQVYEGPGHRTPVDRKLVLERHEPDPPGFERRLARAHASDAVMLRETARGFEYLRRAPAAQEGEDAVRVAAGRGTAVRTLAAGVLVDPNIGDPLPFVGAGYSDFDLFGTGTQLSAFLAGAFAQVSWSAPSLAGSRWRLEAAAVASLVEYNDRVFRGGAEQYAENLRQRPARLAVDFSRPLTARVRLRAGYELAYTRLRRSDLTAADFRAPSSALAHGLRLALDAERGAWSGSVWWRPAWRPRWTPWGYERALEDAASARTYHRYGLRVARGFIPSPRVSARVEAAALAGSGLDRFSRFGFDGFEERLTGYPVASVRFDRGLVVRGAAAWRALPFLRVQGWADAARVRDAGFDLQHRTLAGVGAGAEVPLPFRALLAVEWGHGIQGRDRDGRLGTHTLRVTAYRVF